MCKPCETTSGSTTFNGEVFEIENEPMTIIENQDDNIIILEENYTIIENVEEESIEIKSEDTINGIH